MTEPTTGLYSLPRPPPLGDTYGQQGYYPGVILAQASKPDPTLIVANGVVVLVVGAVATVDYALLGYLVLAGSNAERIIAICLADASFIMLLPLGPAALIWIALGIAGTNFSCMPSAAGTSHQARSERSLMSTMRDEYTDFFEPRFLQLVDEKVPDNTPTLCRIGKRSE